MFGKTTSFETLSQCLIELGFTAVHTWWDSHGEGRQVIFQAEKPCQRLMVIYCDRSGQVTQLGEVPFQDYLLAKELLVLLAEEEGEGRPRYLKGPEKISPCCTASWFDVQDTIWEETIRIHQVAGHGTWAEKLKKEPSKG